MESIHPQEQPKIVPMRGKEVEMMFGDTSLLELERQRNLLIMQLTDLQETIRTGDDPETYETCADKIGELRNQMRDLDRIIRVEQKRFGQKRGPIILR